MTYKASEIYERKFEADGKSKGLEKESAMKEPNGFTTTRALIFVIVFILIVLFFLG
jgi:hypothetical protein